MSWRIVAKTIILRLFLLRLAEKPRRQRETGRGLWARRRFDWQSRAQRLSQSAMRILLLKTAAHPRIALIFDTEVTSIKLVAIFSRRETTLWFGYHSNQIVICLKPSLVNAKRVRFWGYAMLTPVTPPFAFGYPTLFPSFGVEGSYLSCSLFTFKIFHVNLIVTGSMFIKSILNKP